MAEDFRNKPLSELLQDRSIFHIFDEEFQKAGWLDVTALLNSESRIEDLYEDKIVPADVLDRIVEKVSAL
ncbi:MAG: hypothetical protein PUE58_03365 [Lachnospiraceae bacterium]|nr:hypothetical protein [Lachnospiraceae bacterium]